MPIPAGVNVKVPDLAASVSVTVPGENAPARPEAVGVIVTAPGLAPLSRATVYSAEAEPGVPVEGPVRS